GQAQHHCLVDGERQVIEGTNPRAATATMTIQHRMATALVGGTTLAGTDTHRLDPDSTLLQRHDTSGFLDHYSLWIVRAASTRSAVSAGTSPTRVTSQPPCSPPNLRARATVGPTADIPSSSVPSMSRSTNTVKEARPSL